MAQISVDCPRCKAPNDIPVESDEEEFKCANCGETSRIDAATATGSEPQQDYLLGEIISDCKIVKKVGEGGFGSVYKAIDQNLQRTVALKVMLQSLSTNAEFVQKFIREAVTAGSLNHPGIVAIHKVGRDERRGLHYLLMEFVEGETLEHIVREKGVYKLEEAVPIFLQACEALATAHEANIIHRDIKPENLMLTTQGVVKITDFGLAKSLSSDHKTTKVMGTPHYMSPEQFEGRAVDARSDIYSLGVTFYYLLSKQRPYEGTNTVQIIYSILTQPPKSLIEANKDVPAPAWGVIQKMIEKSVEARYQTLRDTITDLKKLVAAAPDDKSGCAQCGAKNPKGRKFCKSCGAALIVACPACNSPEPAGAKACKACGADIDRLVRVKKCLEAAKRFQVLGDLRRAADGFKQVLQLDPQHAEATTELGKLSGALTEVDKVSVETQELMKTGAIEDALSKVEDLLRRYPSAAEVRQQRDDLKQALADRKVNRLVEAAESAAAAGRLREAMESLDQALRVDATREDVRGLRSDLGRRVGLAAENRQKAAEALAAGRYEEAFSLATEVLKVMPGDPAMEELRAKAQSSVASVDEFVSRAQERLAAKKYADALNEFEAALSLRPSDKRLLDFVESVRAKITEQRERVATARRMMADRQFAAAMPILEGVIAELPDDLEARSLRSTCERGLQDSQRLQNIEHALQEAGRLEGVGDFAGAFAQLERVANLDPDNEVARTRRDQIDRKLREEKALRELADEHLGDGLFPDAIDALQRLRSVNPGRAKALDAEIASAKEREHQAKTALERAEKALAAREYRRAAEAAGAVLTQAPKHPRAVAIKKDADKAVVAIDRFLGECDQLLASELFDEALEALDKAKERGATGEEYKFRKESCDQGRLALLKTDATRSIVVKDYEAAIAAYEHVLETKKDDPDAIAGKRAAERRLLILTQEPLSLRVGTAASVLLMLGMVQLTAVAATSERRVKAEVAVNAAAEAAKEKKLDVRKLEPSFDRANLAEKAADWSGALTAYAAELRDFPSNPRLVEGRAFVEAMQAVVAEGSDRMKRLDLVAAAEKLVGDYQDLRPSRTEALRKFRDEAVGARLEEIAKVEATSATAALEQYDALLGHPATGGAAALRDRVESVRLYLEQLKGAERYENPAAAGAKPNYAGAAAAYFRARTAGGDDTVRVKVAQDRLVGLRGKWITAIRTTAAAIPAAEEQRFYDEVVVELAEMSRTLQVPREQIEREFRSTK